MVLHLSDRVCATQNHDKKTCRYIQLERLRTLRFVGLQQIFYMRDVRAVHFSNTAKPYLFASIAKVSCDSRFANNNNFVLQFERRLIQQNARQIFAGMADYPAGRRPTSICRRGPELLSWSLCDHTQRAVWTWWIPLRKTQLLHSWRLSELIAADEASIRAVSVIVHILAMTLSTITS